jgi:asparagine synthase (glutamine-hydrolysing)
MSVQFGRWSFEGEPAPPIYLEKIATMLSPYGPDARSSYSATGINILYCAFHTTRESRLEVQPNVSPSGAVITWDGRLDNRAELIRDLGSTLSCASPDIDIVAGSYERWGPGCFTKLIGDWALSIWNPNDRTLLLAKDFVGARHLYYALDENRLTWSTILDPLVLPAGKSFELDEEYIAGWLSYFPAAHLTPYRRIQAVPPSSYILFRDKRATTHKHWKFDATKTIRYRTDADYEEHFRLSFGQAVRRRLRSDGPVLAELSGGIDSSSIVCIADNLLTQGRADTPRLDTVSYYDDSEPNWNERPYFTKIEQKRGRSGRHIDVSSRHLQAEYRNERMACAPGSSDRFTHTAKQVADVIATQGNRVVLSGIGGDEVLGGVPTPIPELADLLARGRLFTLPRRMVDWALATRRPLVHLGAETVRRFLPVWIAGLETSKKPPVWLQQEFIKRQRRALLGYQTRLKVFGALPSLQENLATLDLLRRQLAWMTLSSQPCYHECYPCLDRDLIEFLFSIPRQQLVRPCQRRSLMRRALVGIVPDEILNRKRKAFVVRGPMARVSVEWRALLAITEDMVSESLGIVNSEALADALRRARSGEEIPIVPLMRTLRTERWLRHLQECNCSGLRTAPLAVAPGFGNGSMPGS